ncbi:MAG: substrate-binding domain-containing protein [Eubacteriales bacterium]|nr:substrate-binding domain-containing protein [Eubacteriales bacterium]
MKIYKYIIALIVFTMLFTSACDLDSYKQEEQAGGKPKRQKFGIFYHDFSDGYISNIRDVLKENIDEAAGFEILEFDGQNNQNTQNQQVAGAIGTGLAVALINACDTSELSELTEMLSKADIPIIFWGREPEDSSLYELGKICYIGPLEEEAGRIQGQLILDYWQAASRDRNKNGKLDYVLLQGGADSAETVARSELVLAVLEDAGIELNKLAVANCDWDRAKATVAVEAWLASDLENIDVIIANNDDMALGAVDALQVINYNLQEEANPESTIGVFGIDATEAGREAVRAGVMMGTVRQSKSELVKALIKVAENVASGNYFISDTEYEMTDGYAIRLPYRAFTGK